jgi:hypothetical protein
LRRQLEAGRADRVEGRFCGGGGHFLLERLRAFNSVD